MATTTYLDPAFLAEDRRSVLVAISVSMAAATTIVLLTRLYAKRFQGFGGFFFDDAFLLAAYIVNLGMCTLGIIITQVGGVGRHLSYNATRDPDALVGWAKCLIAFELIYFVSIALPKLSILCLYMRLFSWRGHMRVLAWVLFALTVATSMSLVLAACFQCTPLAFFWNSTIPGGRCFDIQMFFHAQALPGSALDVVIMALPMPTIWSLKLPLIKRLALVGVFLIAGFGLVASLIRARIFFATAALADETWASVDLIGWSIVETSVYIITCCLPHLRPLIAHLTPHWVKKAVHLTVTKSYGGGTKSGLSGIHKSTAISHSHQSAFTHSHHSKAGGGRDDESAIELKGLRDSATWVDGVSGDDFDRLSAQSAPGSPGCSLGPCQSQSLGVTTEITAGGAAEQRGR